MSAPRFLSPRNDVAFRKIFGTEEHKDILIHFINDVLGLQGNNQVQEVTFLSPIQDPEIASKKESIVDVLCEDKNGVQMIIEMQVAPTKGFEKRAQYYAAKAYSRQLNRGQKEDGKYQNLKEVIFIAISDYVIFEKKKEYISHHVILDKKTYEHDLKDFSFTFIELPKFKKDNIAELNGILEKWCFFFKHADETTEAELKAIIGSDLVIERAYGAIDHFNWSEDELNAYDAELKRIRDNIAALDFQYDKGKEEGREERDNEIAKNLLSQGIDLEIIKQATGLTEQQIAKLKK